MRERRLSPNGIKLRALAAESLRPLGKYLRASFLFWNLVKISLPMEVWYAAIL